METNNHLNKPYPLTNIDEAESTKERILLTATVLFSRKGVADVSIRDIAEEVAISPAAIYNHFESKEVLWDAILNHLEMLYRLYFKRLAAALLQATSYVETLDCMFAELFEVVDIFTYDGFSLIMSEQLRDEKAYRIYNEVFFQYSMNFIADKLDACINKGWAKPFDTRFMSTVFMHTVLGGIVMRTHQKQNQQVPYDIDEQFRRMYRYLYVAGLITDES